MPELAFGPGSRIQGTTFAGSKSLVLEGLVSRSGSGVKLQGNQAGNLAVRGHVRIRHVLNVLARDNAFRFGQRLSN